MAAAELARSLFSEIEEESLDSFLLSLHAKVISPPAPQATSTSAPNPPFLHIPALDAILGPRILERISLPPTRSVAPPARPPPPPPPPQPHLPLQPTTAPAPPYPPVIEIVGLGPCAGKTQLLYRCVAGLLLGDGGDEQSESGLARPKRRATAPAAVVWLDTDGRFDVLRLHGQIESLVEERRRERERHRGRENGIDEDDGGGSGDSSKQIARSCLDYFLHYAFKDFSSLLATVEALPENLRSFPPSSSTTTTGSDTDCRYRQRRIAAIVLSNASAFWWEERKRAATNANDNTNDNANEINPSLLRERTAATLSARYSALATAFRKAQTKLGCMVLSSTWSFTPPPVHSSNATIDTTTTNNRDSGYGVTLGRDEHQQQRSSLSSSSSSWLLAAQQSHLPGVWSKFLDARVAVWRERKRVAVWGPGSGVEEALKWLDREGEGDDGKLLSRRKKFVGRILGGASGRGDLGDPDSSSTEGLNSFRFWVDERGVHGL